MNDIFELVRTEEEARDLIARLREILSSVYETSETFAIDLQRVLSEEEHRAVKAYVGKDADASGRLRQLEEELAGLPVIEITTAIDPSAELQEEVAELVSTSSPRRAIIRFSTDAAITGGVVIYAGGTRRDYSIRTQVQALLQD